MLFNTLDRKGQLHRFYEPMRTASSHEKRDWRRQRAACQPRRVDRSVLQLEHCS